MCAGFLNRNSRTLVFNRNDSATFRPSNIRMMSRFCSAVCRLPAAEYCRCFSESSSRITYFENRESVLPTVVKNASSAPSGRSSFVSARASDLRRGRLEEIEKIPAQNPVDASGLVLEPPLEEFRERRLGAARVPVEIGEEILEDDLAPETLAEEGDVRADNRSQIHQDRTLARDQSRQEFPKRLRGKHLPFAGEGGGRSRRLIPSLVAGVPEQRDYPTF